MQPHCLTADASAQGRQACCFEYNRMKVETEYDAALEGGLEIYRRVISKCKANQR